MSAEPELVWIVGLILILTLSLGSAVMCFTILGLSRSIAEASKEARREERLLRGVTSDTITARVQAQAELEAERNNKPREPGLQALYSKRHSNEAEAQKKAAEDVHVRKPVRRVMMPNDMIPKEWPPRMAMPEPVPETVTEESNDGSATGAAEKQG